MYKLVLTMWLFIEKRVPQKISDDRLFFDIVARSYFCGFKQISLFGFQCNNWYNPN